MDAEQIDLAAAGGEEYNPRNVYKTAIAQAIKRPVFEPLDIDIVGLYMSDDFIKDMKKPKEEVSNALLRTEYLEDDCLLEYGRWVLAAVQTARQCGDLERLAFYCDLRLTIRKDYDDAHDEMKAKQKEALPHLYDHGEVLPSVEASIRPQQNSSSRSSRNTVSTGTEGHLSTILQPISTLNPQSAAPPSPKHRLNCCIIL